MKPAALIVRNIRRRPVAAALTALSVSLGVALFLAVGEVRRAGEAGFQRTAGICNLLVGAKGSPLELTLNALYHMGRSPGNVPFALFPEIESSTGVQWAIPLALGDSFGGHRVVGTTDALFSKVDLGPGPGLEFLKGGPFSFSGSDLVAFHRSLDDGEEGHSDNHAEVFTAVLGFEAAQGTNLVVGDHFHPSHDVAEGGKVHEDAETEVVGILAPTGTPLDRAIFVPAAAYYAMEGHAPDVAREGGARDPRGLSAVLVRSKPGFYSLQLYAAWNARHDAQVVRPADEIQRLFSLVGGLDRALWVIALLVLVVALAGVAVALSNTMASRSREFALLRALGASRSALLGLVSGEAAVVAAAGALLGLVLSGAGLLLAAEFLRARTGIVVSPSFGLEEAGLVLAVTVVGAIAGLIPAWGAYRAQAADKLGGIS